MKQLSYDVVKEAFAKKGYPFNDEELIISGIRMKNDLPDCFNDYLLCTWKDENGNPQFFGGMATTDPGVYYLNNPINTKGTGILVPGFYKHVWTVGIHKTYRALVQCGNFMVWRDNDRDKYRPKIVNGIAYDSTGKELKPMLAGPECGINCHMTIEGVILTTVGKFSALCQVWQNSALFKKMMKVVDWLYKSKQKKYSFALFLEEDFE